VKKNLQLRSKDLTEGTNVERETMFDSLEDRIKLDEHIEISRTESIVKILAITALSILVFGRLYLAIRTID
jgi:hypothetical protein